MRRLSCKYLALLAITTTAACGDSTGIGDLSEAEARELAGALLMATIAVAEEAPDEPPAPVGGPAATPYDYDFETDFVAQCPMDGEVSVVTSVHAEGDDETEQAYREYSMTLVHEDCVVTSPNDVVFTLNGAPEITVDLVLERDGEGNVSFSGELAGAIRYESDQGSDTCPIVVEFGFTMSEATQAFELDAGGSVCGTSFTESLSAG